MTVKLTRPWSDLPAAVGQRYISIIKRGATGPLTVENANGTGAFKLTAWMPGDRYASWRTATTSRPASHTSTASTFVGIPDPVARVNALLSGQVDVISDVPGVQAQLIKSAGIKVIVNPGGGWTPLVMNTNAAPFDDVRVRQAMKHLIDRKQAISVALQGFATVGNDLFARSDPLYASRSRSERSTPRRRSRC